jgi:regulator of PEP synthase PpsR (kinase-PPPase family)
VDRKYHLHLISDSTGDTLNAIANAALAQFENVDVQVHAYALVRSEHQLTRALDHVATAPGLVFFTLANPVLNQKLVARCVTIMGAQAIDVLEAPLNAMGSFFGKSESHKVGRQHQVDERYLDRIETLNFAIAHDDGQAADGLLKAEVVLTGASRTSKTPTCVYLAIRGIRAGNVPLVPGVPPPQALLETRALVVGLWVSPDRLVQVRRNRLMTMGADRETDYVDLDQVRAEVASTRALFEAQGWPSIDVTRRSIEETAAAVMNLLADKRDGAA